MQKTCWLVRLQIDCSQSVPDELWMKLINFHTRSQRPGQNQMDIMIILHYIKCRLVKHAIIKQNKTKQKQKQKWVITSLSISKEHILVTFIILDYHVYESQLLFMFHVSKYKLLENSYPKLAYFVSYLKIINNNMCIYSKVFKKLKNGIKILLGQAVFKTWVKTVKMMFGSM